jgi:hypothetical protein
MNKNFFKVAAFYAFTELLNLEDLQRDIYSFPKKRGYQGHGSSSPRRDQWHCGWNRGWHRSIQKFSAIK